MNKVYRNRIVISNVLHREEGQQIVKMFSETWGFTPRHRIDTLEHEVVIFLPSYFARYEQWVANLVVATAWEGHIYAARYTRGGVVIKCMSYDHAGILEAWHTKQFPQRHQGQTPMRYYETIPELDEEVSQEADSQEEEPQSQEPDSQEEESQEEEILTVLAFCAQVQSTEIREWCDRNNVSVYSFRTLHVIGHNVTVYEVRATSAQIFDMHQNTSALLIARSGQYNEVLTLYPSDITVELGRIDEVITTMVIDGRMSLYRYMVGFRCGKASVLDFLECHIHTVDARGTTVQEVSYDILEKVRDGGVYVLVTPSLLDKWTQLTKWYSTVLVDIELDSTTTSTYVFDAEDEPTYYDYKVSTSVNHVESTDVALNTHFGYRFDTQKMTTTTGVTGVVDVTSLAMTVRRLKGRELQHVLYVRDLITRLLTIIA